MYRKDEAWYEWIDFVQKATFATWKPIYSKSESCRWRSLSDEWKKGCVFWLNYVLQKVEWKYCSCEYIC